MNRPGAPARPPFEYPRELERRCDIVMKGGITSGVVYPHAVCRLAGHFHLQRIGGTSAGAIAAAAAAAAEYGRRNGTGEGFRALEELPGWLGARPPGSDDSNLFHLFQPAPATRELFALLVAAISHPRATVPLELLLSALANRRRWAIAGALPGAALFALLFLALASDGGFLAAVALVSGLVAATALAVAGAVAAVSVKLARAAPAALAGNGLGICSGLAPDARPEPAPPALTPWLHALIGRASGVAVLTFGDLWGRVEGPRQLDLAMITTCLTLGRPYRLPLTREDAFWFDPEELRRFFPPEVVEHLERHAGQAAIDGRLPLPPAEDLPVVVAARLSLSFPLLLSTIPLHRLSADDDGAPVFTRCHFSDGGICSNFPIHFFDSPLPRWPTFGFNLAGPVVDGVDVWMPDSNQGLPAPPTREVTGVVAFAKAIRGAMQNWHDNAHVELPGYRDRIAHIRFEPGEGGLNVNMPPTLIAALSDRGERAGRKLVARFAGGPVPGEAAGELDWENHRRIRQRVTLTALEELVLQVAVGHTGDHTIAAPPSRFLPHDPPPGERSYDDLLAEPARYPPIDAPQRELALDVLALLVPLARGWAVRRGRDLPPRGSPAFDFGGPKPPLDVRIVPPL